MIIRSTYTLILIALLYAFPQLPVMAKGPELKFTSIVTAVNQTDLENGIVGISIQAMELEILVNRDTEVEYLGDQVGIGEISAGDVVEIRAFFADEGITAEEVEILQTSFQQFRLHGVITAIDVAGETSFITVTDVEVKADGSTVVVPRSNSDVGSLSALLVGDEVSINGRLEEGVLKARQIFVGSHEQGEIEFDGIVLAIGDNTLTIEVVSGVVVEVQVGETTRVRGNPTVGSFVEIEGRLDSTLALTADEVAVDSDGDQDADDDNTEDNGGSSGNTDSEVSTEVALQAVNSSLSGKAEVRLRNRDGAIDQKFEVEVEDSAPGVVYSILVYFGAQSVDFGTFTTNEFGEASAEFEVDDSPSQNDLAPLLPAGKSVLDISSVQILRDGVVAEGSF